VKTLLIILFPFLLSAQTDVIITSTLWSAISGRTEYHRMEDRRLAIEGNEDYLRHSKIWHALEVPEVLSAFSVGGVIALDSFKGNFKPLVALSDLFLVASIRWMVYDGVYNLSNNNNWFHRSNTSMSFLEPMGSPFFKIMILINALVFRLIVERI